ncbi:hypothetical protein B4589_008345 [Halolamina sp. CBA1230]|uniref:DUF7854 family protein n=1 Tax=Halolamina sp. CBA1230 TaxID=1853690 RepID=UPI0009A1665A|nr:hypothetical protein [Halolamina sp. CBA1230]QKY21725.1 hypothetical protein B4589_008345 [Halolamina sp. CBA1230]
MDHISALRNIEEALRAFEDGEADLATTQRRVQSVLQSYATEFEAETRRPYRAHGEAPADGVVVVAPDAETASERVEALADAESASFDVEPL